MIRRHAFVAAAAWLATMGVSAQEAPPAIWQGVYSAAQAERGKGVYLGACIRCHGADLAGTTAPALKGDRFLTTWGGESLSRLFEKIRDTMPPNFSTTLDDGAKRDIVAFILQNNGYPAAGRELPTGNDLAAIQILRKGEQARVQNFSLVQAVGCLSRGQDQWLLRSSTTPAAATDSAPTDSALAAAASVPLGTATFVLLSTAPFKPAGSEGQKVEVRGLIYQEAGDALLTVTSLKAIGNCR